jgi:hypothetical protein
MKTGSLLFLSALLYCSAFAQTHTATVDYQKVSREALVNEVNYSDNTVSGAIEENMRKNGVKGKSSKGFIVYKGIAIPELGSGSYDLYFSVDRKSKKEKEISSITMMISKGEDNFITSASDPEIMSKAKTYLDNLWDMISVYDLEQQIGAQEDLVKKNEKKLKNLAEDGTDLEKKRKKIEEEIKDNVTAQTSQQEELDNQRKILETLKGKRKQ